MTYVYNRRLGRVGKPLGTHVAHVDGTITIYDPSKDKIPLRIYADNPDNWKLGRVPGEAVTTPFPCRFYVDNPSNRRLGRAGEPYVGLDAVYHRLQTVRDYGAKEGPQPETSKEELHPRAKEEPHPEVLHPRAKEELHLRPKEDIHPRAKEELHPRATSQTEATLSTTEPLKAEEKQRLSQPNLRLRPTLPRDVVKSSCTDGAIHDQEKPSADRIHLWAVSFDNGTAHSHRGGIRLFGKMYIPGDKGHIYAGSWNGQPVIFKKFNISPTLTRSEKWRIKVKWEMKALYKLVHPNIATIYGGVLDVGNIGVVMEYFQCNLYQALFVGKQEFSEFRKIALMKQISEGVEFLHGHGVALCNLSSGSVHLSTYSCAKIQSFGPKTVCCENESLLDHIDERYAAPEIIQNGLTTAQRLQKADIYSLALVLYELFENKLASKSVPVKMHAESAALNLNIPSSVFHLLVDCWNGSPDNRPEAAVFSQLTL